MRLPIKLGLLAILSMALPLASYAKVALASTSIHPNACCSTPEGNSCCGATCSSSGGECTTKPLDQ